MCYLTIWIFLRKDRSHLYFKNWLLYSFILELLSSLYILDTYMMFLPFCLLTLFTLSIVSFGTQQFLILIKSNLCFFLSLFVFLVPYIRNNSLSKDHKDLLLSYSKRIMVLSLTCRFVIHFRLIFVLNVR